VQWLSQVRRENAEHSLEIPNQILGVNDGALKTARRFSIEN